MPESNPTPQPDPSLDERLQAQHAAAIAAFSEWMQDVGIKHCNNLKALHPETSEYRVVRDIFIDAYILGNNDERIMSVH